MTNTWMPNKRNQAYENNVTLDDPLPGKPEITRRPETNYIPLL